jgi:hypothetical protein
MARSGKVPSYFLYALVMSGLIAFIVFLEAVDTPLRNAIIEEGGLVESLSVLGYFFCLALVLLLVGSECRYCWYVPLLLLFFGLRELDFQNRFTVISISKLAFYRSPDVPFAVKFAGAAAIVLMFAAAADLVKKHLGNVMRAIARGEPYAIGVLAAAVFLGISKLIDGLPRKLGAFGIAVEPTVTAFAADIEESLELGIPVMLLIAILMRFYKHPTARAVSAR